MVCRDGLFVRCYMVCGVCNNDVWTMYVVLHQSHDMRLPLELLKTLRSSAGRGCTPQELETILVEGHYEEVRLIAVKELQRRRVEEYNTMVSNYESRLAELERFRANL